jgi:ABC-type Mn2+/Zn2+ transport system permease subunit
MLPKNSLTGIYKSFFQGIRESSVGRKLIIIIGIKLIIIFLVLKLFFFKDYLNSRFDNDKAKSQHVIERLTTNKSVK